MITRRDRGILFAFAGWFTINYSFPRIVSVTRDHIHVTLTKKSGVEASFRLEYFLERLSKQAYDHFNIGLANTKASHRKIWVKYLDDRASLENVMKDFEHLFLPVFMSMFDEVTAP